MICAVGKHHKKELPLHSNHACQNQNKARKMKKKNLQKRKFICPSESRCGLSRLPSFQSAGDCALSGSTSTLPQLVLSAAKINHLSIWNSIFSLKQSHEFPNFPSLVPDLNLTIPKITRPPSIHGKGKVKQCAFCSPFFSFSSPYFNVYWHISTMWTCDSSFDNYAKH